jgi:hypothetical protein
LWEVKEEESYHFEAKISNKKSNILSKENQILSNDNPIEEIKAEVEMSAF